MCGQMVALAKPANSQRLAVVVVMALDSLDAADLAGFTAKRAQAQRASEG